MTPDRDLLIIGYGNSLRRDDGAGLILAGQLAGQWLAQGCAVQLLLEHQLGPELAVDIADPEVGAVLFVDAAAGLDRPWTLTPLAPDSPSPGLTHHLSPHALLLYAAQLYTRCPPGWLLRIQGQEFGHGESLSPAAAAAVAGAADQSERIWERLWGTNLRASS